MKRPGQLVGEYVHLHGLERDEAMQLRVFGFNAVELPLCILFQNRNVQKRTGRGRTQGGGLEEHRFAAGPKSGDEQPAGLQAPGLLMRLGRTVELR